MRHRASLLLGSNTYRASIIENTNYTLEEKIKKLIAINFAMGLPAPVPLSYSHGTVQQIGYLVLDGDRQILLDVRTRDIDPDFLRISSTDTLRSQHAIPEAASDEESTDTDSDQLETEESLWSE